MTRTYNAPTREEDEALTHYWLRVVEAAPEGAELELDEPNDRVRIIYWPENDAEE